MSICAQEAAAARAPAEQTMRVRMRATTRLRGASPHHFSPRSVACFQGAVEADCNVDTLLTAIQSSKNCSAGCTEFITSETGSSLASLSSLVPFEHCCY